MDISYIPMARGFVCLAAVIDWHSRCVLAWRLSISMDTAFCTEAVEEAIAKYGKPDIFNTDQRRQFTSSAFIGLLLEHGIRISMDGKGCWRYNVFIERVWRSKNTMSQPLTRKRIYASYPLLTVFAVCCRLRHATPASNYNYQRLVCPGRPTKGRRGMAIIR